MAAGMIFCAGETVFAKFAEHYFKDEIADDAPFSLGGAKEMQRLGILTICFPIGTQIFAEIVHAVMEQTMRGTAPLRLNNAGSVALGGSSGGKSGGIHGFEEDYHRAAAGCVL